jgi:hypothetical protein
MATQRTTLEGTDVTLDEMDTRARRPSGLAVGVIVFAAVMMAIVGGLHIIAGIAALIEDQFFVIGREYVYEFDVTTWGWIHLIAGIVVFVASFGLFTGRLWARTVGVLVAAASLILNFMYLPYYPVWSVVMIAVAILVIWALTFHGRDIARESW